MCRHFPGGQPPSCQRQHDLVDAVQPALPLAHDLRLEAAVPVARHLDLDRADLGQHRLRPNAVAGVAAVAPGRIVLVIAQVAADLLLQRGLHHRLGQPGQQTALTDELHTLLTRLPDEILRQSLLINLSRHGLDRLGHCWSFPAKQPRRVGASYTEDQTVPHGARRGRTP